MTEINLQEIDYSPLKKKKYRKVKNPFRRKIGERYYNIPRKCKTPHELGCQCAICKMRIDLTITQNYISVCVSRELEDMIQEESQRLRVSQHQIVRNALYFYFIRNRRKDIEMDWTLPDESMSINTIKEKEMEEEVNKRVHEKIFELTNKIISNENILFT